MCHPRQNRASGNEGFALVLALSLMAFVLLLLVSMTLIIRVETQTASGSLDSLRAKEAARLALMIGLGDLQKHMGPDQRVTAKAEILGNGNYAAANRHWTGVWNTNEPNGTPIWLVSGRTPNPNNTGPDDLVVYSNEQSTDPAAQIVNAPSQLLSDSQNRKLTFAWWIADEGVKVNIGLPERLQPLDDGFFIEYDSDGLSPEEQNQILKQISPRRFRSEHFFGDDTRFVPTEIEDISNTSVLSDLETNAERLTRAYTLRDTEFLTGIDANELGGAFHHATTLSKSLLTNTENGGLKLDLSDRSLETTGSGFNVTPATRNFLWSGGPDINGQIDFRGIEEGVVDDLLPDDPVNTTPVIITEASLYFAISGQGKSSSTARAFLRFEGEMWSPYGFRHKFSGSSSSDTPELIIEFEDLPEISLSYFDKDIESFTNSTVLNFEDITPRFQIDFTETHKAGEIRKITGEWEVNASSNPQNFYYTDTWGWQVSDVSYNEDHRGVSFPTGDSINYTSPSSKVTMLVKNQDGDLLQRIENIPVGAINADFSFYESSPSSLSQTSAPVAFQFRMRDDLLDLEDWLSKQDLRNIVLDFSDADLLALYDINDVDGDDQMDADLPRLNPFENIDFFHGQQNNNFFRLYDVPAAPPITVGVFQHLQFKDKPSHAIGNVWGGDLNDVFDRFFISSIPRDTTEAFWKREEAKKPGTLPNPFIALESSTLPSMADLQLESSAQYLFSEGCFNFNSTSVEAWQALLLGNSIYDWTWYRNRGTSTETTERRLNLEFSYFRLPFSGHLRSEAFSKWEFPFELYEEETSTSDDYPFLDASEKELTFRSPDPALPLKDWRPAFSLGHRELTKPAALELATTIVQKLTQRGRPFYSFKEFINSGTMQDAIDETTINSIEPDEIYNDAETSKRLPRNSTAFLSQADLFSSLSPAMAPRSDTFRIRAFAKVEESTNQNLVAQTYCEAIVQRIPSRVDGDNKSLMNNSDGFGRNFKIIDIRWGNTSQF